MHRACCYSYFCFRYQWEKKKRRAAYKEAARAKKTKKLRNKEERAKEKASLMPALEKLVGPYLSREKSFDSVEACLSHACSYKILSSFTLI